MSRLSTALALATGWLTVLGVGVAASASANPSTTPRYNGSASATAYAGLAFDQCTAPSLTSMQGGLLRHIAPSASTSAA